MFYLCLKEYKIHVQLLRVGDLANIVLVMPQGYLGIQLMKFMLTAEDPYRTNAF